VRPEWDFEFVPLHFYADDAARPERDFVVSTETDVDAATLVAALGDLSTSLQVTPLVSMHPLFWNRVELGRSVSLESVERLLIAAGVRLRYVTSSTAGSQRVTRSADFSGARPRRARDWRARAAREAPLLDSPGNWFLGPLGVNVTRAICGTGAGTRLAVIDNDFALIESLELDARVLVEIDHVPSASLHGAIGIAWAVGTAPRASGRRFYGVAPDASTRIYCVPKPGTEIFAVPTAIVRAVDDGADVILCATYLDGVMSPLLDDALEFARCLGRQGRGTAVVLPPSREMSSARSSVHASLSLGPAEPASDPRVFCVGPSSRDGGWFLWRDRRGKLHPFANRGPALRWLAPGDDMVYPFADVERCTHAESSGAAAIGAGVLLLVLGQNPELTVDELAEVVTKTAMPIDAATSASVRELADACDLMPTGLDADRHNAKHGYGRMNATLAVAAARDPISATLISIGEASAAVTWEEKVTERPYDACFGMAAARVVLRDPAVRHALAALARTLRLWSLRPERRQDEHPGTLARQALVALRLLLRSCVIEQSRWNSERRTAWSDLETSLEKEPLAFERGLLESARVLGRRLDTGARPSSKDLGRFAPVSLEHDLSA
jgi:hypothetical protein